MTDIQYIYGGQLKGLCFTKTRCPLVSAENFSFALFVGLGHKTEPFSNFRSIGFHSGHWHRAVHFQDGHYPLIYGQSQQGLEVIMDYNNKEDPTRIGQRGCVWWSYVGGQRSLLALDLRSKWFSFYFLRVWLNGHGRIFLSVVIVFELCRLFYSSLDDFRWLLGSRPATI